jgi:hypothetical protein
VAFGGPASGNPQTGKKFFFDGVTQQGVEVFFIIENDGGTMYFEPFFTNFNITCPDGTTFPFEWFFLNWKIALDSNNYFDINLPSAQLPFDWNGTLTGRNASGVQSQGYASYDINGNVQDCGTGLVPWHATGVGSKPKAGRSHVGYTVTVQRDQNGEVHETITVG